MLSSVLRSDDAVQVDIEIVRDFVPLREILARARRVAQKLAAHERERDAQLRIVFDAIRDLTKSLEPSRKGPIRFTPWNGDL